jgi:hypothetical protein
MIYLLKTMHSFLISFKLWISGTEDLIFDRSLTEFILLLRYNRIL